jgi:hypothetical protein
LASTFLPIPSIVTTLTQPNTFSISSHANTVCLHVWTDSGSANKTRLLRRVNRPMICNAS